MCYIELLIEVIWVGDILFIRNLIYRRIGRIVKVG